jgi:hypothetical protein
VTPVAAALISPGTGAETRRCPTEGVATRTVSSAGTTAANCSPGGGHTPDRRGSGTLWEVGDAVQPDHP